MDLRLKLRNLLFRLLNLFENNNNADIYKNGEYALLNTCFKRYTGKKFILFDVGANVGTFSITALKAFQQVVTNKEIEIHAFEPLPSTSAQLRANLTQDNFKIVNSGISETGGNAEIFYTETNDTCASLYNRAELNAASSMNISLIRLDTYMKENNITGIDFLKIDTEGNELAALKSAGDYLNPVTIKTIQFEYGGTYLDSRIYLRDIYNLLIPKGYKIYKIYSKKIKQRDYHPALENFQYANYVALA